MNQSQSDGGLIGPELIMRGNLSGEADLRIEGQFDGGISLKGELSLGPEAVVKAPTRVLGAEIEGELRGDLHAEGAVNLRSGARVVGNVRARRIGIDDGAHLDGGIEMDFELDDEGHV